MTPEFQRAVALVASKHRMVEQTGESFARAQQELREAESALLAVMPSDVYTDIAIGSLLIRFDEEFPDEWPVRYSRLTNLAAVQQL